MLNASSIAGRPGRSDTRRGFTLVELLVVIGIIALLISILLPSLNRAREAAKTVKCSANLRSLGQGLQIYLQDNKGMMPIGFWDGINDPSKDVASALPTSNPGGADGRKTNWGLLVLNRLNPKFSTNIYDVGQMTGQNASSSYQMLLCPSVDTGRGATNAGGGINRVVNHYSAHPRLLPVIGGVNGTYKDPATGRPYTTVRASRVKRSSEIATLFDGSLVLSADGSYLDAANGGTCVAINMDGYRYLYGSAVGTTYMTDNYTGASMKNTDPVDMRTNGEANTNNRNTDSQANERNIRFRHVGNSVANVLMMDGHVEGFTLNRDKVGTNLIRSNINTSF